MGSEQPAMSPAALECCRTTWPPRKPVAPVTRISFFIRQELLPTVIKLVYRAHVVVDAPNIQPITRVAFDVDRLFVRKHVQHQVIEAILLSRRHALKNRSIQDVNPHAHQILKLRFFLKSYELV